MTRALKGQVSHRALIGLEVTVRAFNHPRASIDEVQTGSPTIDLAAIHSSLSTSRPSIASSTASRHPHAKLRATDQVQAFEATFEPRHRRQTEPLEVSSHPD